MPPMNYRPQARALLVPGLPMYEITDKKIRWIGTSGCVARAELLKQPPATSAMTRSAPSTTDFRALLAAAREDTLTGVVKPTDRLVVTQPEGSAAFGNALEVVLVGHRGGLLTTVDADAWDRWHATGLSPKLTSSGALTFWGRIRGTHSLFGYLMPVLVHARIR